MQAQWVCSRERRIALYKRLSLNHSINQYQFINHLVCKDALYQFINRLVRKDAPYQFINHLVRKDAPRQFINHLVRKDAPY